MLENFILSFNVIFPLFLIMAIGYALRCLHVINETTVKQMNAFVFKVSLPLLLFYNVIGSDITSSFNPKLLLYAVCAVLAEFVLCLCVVLFSEKDNKKRGVMLQAMFRSNFVIFGVPVATALFGEQGAGIASILTAVVVPTFNILAVASLVVFGGGKFNPLKILKGIVTNPLVIASLFGVIVLLTGFKLPAPLLSAVSSLSKIATPLAFILLGASFNFGEIAMYVRQLSISLSARLIFMPLIFVSIAIALGFRDASLAIVLTIFGSPVAVSSFTMAQQMGGDDKLAGQLVVFSSILCIVTMFLWIFALKQLAFF